MATLVYSLDANNPSSYPGSGSSWFDVSGNTYSTSPTMSLVNAPSFVNAGDYKYLQFTNSAGSYATYALAGQDSGPFSSTTLAYRMYRQSFSVAMWVRLDASPFVGVSGVTDPQCLTTMGWQSSGLIQFAVACGGSSTYSQQNQWSAAFYNGGLWWTTSTTGITSGSGYTMSVGAWHHVVAVYEVINSPSNIGSIKFYVDGLLRTQLYNMEGVGLPIFDGSKSQNIYINRSWNLPPSSAATVGSTSFNLYQIYQGVLSSSEIIALYNGGFNIPAPINQRGVPPELGLPVTTRQFSWNEMARRAWGSEFSAPDHRVYEFSNGRGFDSTDRGDTGFYEPPST